MFFSSCILSSNLLLFELQVFAGSAAEKRGIRIGDVIENLNGESIATSVEVHINYIGTSNCSS